MKEKVQINPLVPIHQQYENQRAEERKQTQTTLLAYCNVKDRFKRSLVFGSSFTLQQKLVGDLLLKLPPSPLLIAKNTVISFKYSIQ